MTGSADLVNLDQQRVPVTIERYVFDGLSMTAGFAFHPKFLPRPAPEMRLAALDCFFERGPIHPRHHQHASGLLFLDDRRNQSIHVKFQIFVKAHPQTGWILQNTGLQTTKKGKGRMAGVHQPVVQALASGTPPQVISPISCCAHIKFQPSSGKPAKLPSSFASAGFFGILGCQ